MGHFTLQPQVVQVVDLLTCCRWWGGVGAYGSGGGGGGAGTTGGTGGRGGPGIIIIQSW